MDTPNVRVVYEDDVVVIFVFEPLFDVLVLNYEDFNELAFAIRQSPYGR